MWKESETSIKYTIRIDFETKFPKRGGVCNAPLKGRQGDWIKSFVDINRCDDSIQKYNG